MISVALSPPDVDHSERGSSASQAPARFFSDAGTVAGPASSGPHRTSHASPAYFTMPTPPSANSLFRNLKGKGRVKSSTYEDFIRRGVAAIRLQGVMPIPGRVVVVIGVERMDDRADIDNRLKAMLDTIVTAGVLVDDKFVTAIAISWLPKANGLSHVFIHPVQSLGLRFQPSHNGASGGWFLNAPDKDDEDGDQPIQS